MNLPGKRSNWLKSFEKYEFEVSGRPVTIVCPKHPLEGTHWGWKGEFLNAFPDTELALLEKGLYIVYMQFPDMFGAPEVVEKWNELYTFLTKKHQFSEKPALIGLSRGGLYCYQWAIANPGKVSCIYGDAPVCDIRSWPGGKGKGCGSSDDWKKLMYAYEFTSESEALLYDKNPVDNLLPLASNNIPILHVYGESDDVVPWEENTGVIAKRYKNLGGRISLIGKPGCSHHPHGLNDPTPIVDFILQHTVLNKSLQETRASSRS